MGFRFAPSTRQVLEQLIRQPEFRKLTNIPRFAPMEIGLTAAAFALFCLSSYLYLSESISWLSMTALNSFAIYASFTPLHDATHRTASSNRQLNDLLGTISCLLLLPGITTRIYRYLHLEHHRYSGDLAKDPDEPFVSSRGWKIPLTLAGLDILWTRWYLSKWETRPSSERLEFAISISLYLLFHVAWLTSTYALEFILVWVIPQRLGLFYVAWFFARIQHPKEVLWEQTPFQATVRIITKPFARLMLLGQANHHMHHLAPSVPYYRYHRAWDLGKSLLANQAIPTRSIFAESQNLRLPVPPTSDWLVARVQRVDVLASDLRRYVLVPANNHPWPAFTAGAHIDVSPTPTLVRQYSLCNSPSETHRYVICVKRDPKSTGGSEHIHARIRVGDKLSISHPRNNFELDTTHTNFTLVAGGIGITPLLSMAQQLIDTQRQFMLHVCANSKSAAAIQQLTENQSYAKHVVHHRALGLTGEGFNPTAELGEYESGRALYLCGPAGFMTGVSEAAKAMGWPSGAIITEYFSSDTSAHKQNTAFSVELARSGKVLHVGADESLLDVLNNHHCAVICSCTQGICGSCMTPVLSGVPEHRDAVMTDAQRDQNNQMTVCVSRARSTRLTLDL